MRRADLKKALGGLRGNEEFNNNERMPISTKPVETHLYPEISGYEFAISGTKVPLLTESEVLGRLLEQWPDQWF